MQLFNDKLLYTLSKWGSSKFHSSALDFPWQDNINSGTVINCYTEEPTIETISYQDINIPEQSYIYFNSHACFPRYKLQNTSYKRTIKTEKSNYIIIPTFKVYITTREYRIWDIGNAFVTISATIDEMESRAAIREKFNPESLELIYTGKIYALSTYNKDIYENVKNNIYKNLICDDDFDKYISKTLSIPTEEDISSIFQMLSATDKASVKLAMELLNTMDITVIPNTVYVLLSMFYDRIKESCDINSVTNKRLFSTVQPKRYSDVSVTAMSKLLTDAKFNSESDQKYCTTIMKRLIHNYMTKIVVQLNNKINPYNLNITYELQ